jgi:hypothetical protein
MKMVEVGRFRLPDRDSWPTWAGLRSIGNSLPVKASIVVPAIGYLIVLNETVADYLKLHGIEWSHDPATTWDRIWGLKLYLVYFGLMCLGLGAAIYQWKCPPFVKKHADWADYVAAVQPHTDGTQIDVLAEIVGEPQMFVNLHSRDEILRYYLRKHYTQMSAYDFGWRVATAVLFFIGFVLLSIPSMMTAVRVLIALAT